MPLKAELKTFYGRVETAFLPRFSHRLFVNLNFYTVNNLTAEVMKYIQTEMKLLCWLTFHKNPTFIQTIR